MALLAVTSLIAALALPLMGGATAMADINGCPNGGTGSPQTSNLVGASLTTNGNNVTYYFDSLVDRGPTAGVPGLIAYCVYPTPNAQPDSVTTVAVGADTSAWQDPPSFDNFAFERQGGNPSNIALDGTTGIEMGTATWNDGAPGGQSILLHINDAQECDRLYGGNPGTCFVVPGSPQTPDAKPLTVSKDANGSFDDTFAWTIQKDVDKTIVKQVGGTATFKYTVSVTHDSGTVSKIAVTGSITVNNPNGDPVAIDGVTDQLSDETPCSVTGGGPQDLPVGDTTFGYTCSLSEVPTDGLFNKATVSWAEQTLGNGSDLAGDSADFTTGAILFTENAIDECASVSDSFAGPLGLVCVGNPNPTSFQYSRTVPVPQYDCKSYDNTATFTANDTGTTSSASQTVKVCGPAKTGALTMGFWQNKNGQGIITSGAAVSGVCKSGTWLRQFAPYQDLSASASCSQVATYVYNVIKAANAGGSTMNAMLKAQMLATSLDTYFSDPALGGNKINAPAPIGGVAIDLTMICKMIDGSGGVATCSGAFQNASGAFGGATSLTVSQILSYAAGQSNAGGSTWYGNIKVTQELAKNTFDAINNQVAFGA
jgi:hypothetical protein